VKYYYSLEEQLMRIAEETEFSLSKSPFEMNEAELDNAEKEASKYVIWVKDDEYIQWIPIKKSDGARIYP